MLVVVYVLMAAEYIYESNTWIPELKANKKLWPAFVDFENQLLKWTWKIKYN